MNDKQSITLSTFEDALKYSKQTLTKNADLFSSGLLETEAEQLVIGAYRKAKNRSKTFGRNDLYMMIMNPYPKEASEILFSYLNERITGKPLQYILGYQTFLYHEYLVTPDTLIPRPETESLVYEIVQHYKREINQPQLGFECGLGTGCISIELLKIFPELKMIGTELNDGAIEVTLKNRDRIIGNESRLEIFKTSEKEIVPIALKERMKNSPFDFIVSNPPYLAGREEMNDDVWDFEPHMALLSPKNDVNYFYREIILQMISSLKEGGYLFFEIPHERAEEIFLLLKEWGEPIFMKDLTGRDRMIKLRRILNG